MTAAQMAQYASRYIKRYGAQIVVTRPADSSTRTVWCLPVPLAANAARRLQMEAGFNLSEQTAHMFTFEGTADVLTGDQLPYAGKTWELLAAIPTQPAGANVMMECVGVPAGA